jgi:hypothetical protein
VRGIPWLSWILALALLPFQSASDLFLSTSASSAARDSALKQVVNPNWRPPPAPAGPPYDVFLPLVARNYAQPLLVGAYPYDWAGLESTYTGEMTPFDTWVGKKHSILGTFIDISPSSGYPVDVTGQLSMIWSHGYTPFVNLMADSTSAAQIANGSKDSSLNSWALAFKTYAEGGSGRAAFIAPLPEMNGVWTPYYNADPTYFKNAYAHIREVFANNSVPAGSVRWVFAPNGYSLAEDPFEEYYPGDSVTDVIGFSSYNYGFYPSYGTRWDNPSFTFGNYLPRLRAMTSVKPIIFSQTGTTAWASGSGRDDSAKNQWLVDAFNYLASQSQVRGFIYYNTPRWEMIDWPVYGDHALILPPNGYIGYQTGAANPAYRYIAPADLKNMPLLP